MFQGTWRDVQGKSGNPIDTNAQKAHLKGAGKVADNLGKGHVLTRLHNLHNAKRTLAFGCREEWQHYSGVHAALLRLARAQVHFLAVLLHVARHLRLRADS